MTREGAGRFASPRRSATLAAPAAYGAVHIVSPCSACAGMVPSLVTWLRRVTVPSDGTRVVTADRCAQERRMVEPSPAYLRHFPGHSVVQAEAWGEERTVRAHARR